jgi:PcRGLX-like protein central beta sandwich domain/PcRGLX-like protein C-terminal alpha/alpha toroid domain/PcRGLX-like N-terminal RIFT barrel domain
MEAKTMTKKQQDDRRGKNKDFFQGKQLLNTKLLRIFMKSIFALFTAFICLSSFADKICTLKTTSVSEKWPVTFGIPFKQGQVKDVKSLSIDNMPAQIATLSKWTDGSIKWALIDFIAVPGMSEYSILNNEKSNNDVGELAKKSADGISINTGKIQIFVPKADNKNSLFEINQSKGADLKMTLLNSASNAPQQENWLLEAPVSSKATDFSAVLDSTRKIEIEENGPLRTAIKISGWLQAKSGRKAFKYILRIHAFKDSSEIKFQHTFIATEDVKTNFLRSMQLFVPVEGKNMTATAACAGKTISKKIGKANALALTAISPPKFYHLVSYKDIKPVQCRIEYKDRKWQELTKGKNTPGWIEANTSKENILCVLKDFKYLHPKELKISADGISVYLWADRGNKILDLRRRSEKLIKKYVENGRDANDGKGIAKTHEFWFKYSKSPVPPKKAEAFAYMVNNPIYPYAGADYYRKTDAFGQFLPGGKAFPRIEAAIDFGFKYMRAMRQSFHLDGMIDWGDVSLMVAGQRDHGGKINPEGIPFRGYSGWCNSDFALCHGFFLHYLRTGNQQVLKDGIDMTMHVMDIDTEHYAPENPKAIGLGHRHDQQHWGNGLRGYCYAPHASIDMFLLTGNRRALDVAREMAKNIGYYGRYMTLRLWEITEEKKYLEKAEKALKQDLRGGKEPGWPFLLKTNFRTASYDNIGYIFYDSIKPSEKLEKAFKEGIAYFTRSYVTAWENKAYPPYGILALGHKYNPSPENTEILKIALWRLKPNLPKKPGMLKIAENAPWGEYQKLNLKTLKMQRTDIFSLFFTANLPYILEQLRLKGVKEEECLDYKWKWTEPDSFEEKLISTKIKPISPFLKLHSWNYYTKNLSPGGKINPLMPADIQRKWAAAIRRHKLYEDNKLISPHPFSRSMIRKNGKYGWSRRLSGALVFATTDNSDPRKNGRKYRLVYTSEKDWKWQDKPSFTETLKKDNIYPFPDASNNNSKSWCYLTDNESPDTINIYPAPTELTAKWKASLTRHSFSEDGKTLSFVKSYSPLRKGSHKGWTRFQNLVVFTTKDGSDPRKNNKKYVLSYISEKEESK